MKRLSIWEINVKKMWENCKWGTVNNNNHKNNKLKIIHNSENVENDVNVKENVNKKMYVKYILYIYIYIDLFCRDVENVNRYKKKIYIYIRI